MRKTLKARNNKRLAHIFKRGHEIYAKDVHLTYIGKRIIMGFPYLAFNVKSYSQVGNLGSVCEEASWSE